MNISQVYRTWLVGCVLCVAPSSSSSSALTSNVSTQAKVLKAVREGTTGGKPISRSERKLNSGLIYTENPTEMPTLEPTGIPTATKPKWGWEPDGWQTEEVKTPDPTMAPTRWGGDAWKAPTEQATPEPSVSPTVSPTGWGGDSWKGDGYKTEEAPTAWKAPTEQATPEPSVTPTVSPTGWGGDSWKGDEYEKTTTEPSVSPTVSPTGWGDDSWKGDEYQTDEPTEEPTAMPNWENDAW